MTIDNKLKDILDKDMERREFLQYIGAAILSILGIAGIIRVLLHGHNPTSKVQLFGYGSSTYGGTKKPLS